MLRPTKSIKIETTRPACKCTPCVAGSELCAFINIKTGNDTFRIHYCHPRHGGRCYNKHTGPRTSAWSSHTGPHSKEVCVHCASSHPDLPSPYDPIHFAEPYPLKGAEAVRAKRLVRAWLIRNRS